MPPRASPVPAAGQRPDPAHVLTKAVLRSASLLGAPADLVKTAQGLVTTVAYLDRTRAP